MVEGLEVPQMIEELKENHKLKSDITSEMNLADTASFCNRFQTHVSALFKVYKDELITVNSCRIILPDEYARFVRSLNVKMKSHFDEFRAKKSNLALRKVTINNAIEKNFTPDEWK